MTALLIVLATVLTAPVGDLPESGITKFLAGLPEKPFAARISDVAAAGLGTPYQDGPLGEGPGAKYDTDPLIDLQHEDCVTFVEQTLALAASRNYDEAFALLQKIRYKQGKIDFGARNHFFITDWIANNPWCRDISQDLGVEATALTRTISHREFFKKQKAPEYGQDTADLRQTIHYVPVAAGAAAEKKLPDSALVVFVGKVDWLFALHCGLYLRNADGAGVLYHASSKAGKVITTPLAQYLADNKERYLGFTAYEIAPPKW